MTKLTKEILANQIESDLGELKKDVEAGLYDKNLIGYLEARDKIMKKIWQLEQYDLPKSKQILGRKR
jgi:hypothetical protein